MSMTEKTKNEPLSQRNSEIDLLRFAFSVMILLFHADVFYGNDRPFPSGNFCVEFFFLVSGYLMMQSITKKNRNGTPVSVGRETARFLSRKIAALMPEYLIAWIISFAVVCTAKKLSFSGAFALFVSDWWELNFLKMTGLNGGDVNGVIWYISSMLLCMALLYPLVRKFPDTMVFVVLPLMSAFLLGWLYQNGTLRTKPQDWMGFTYKGNIRALAEISLGIICYQITGWLKQLHLSTAGKVLLSVLKWVCMLGVIAAIAGNIPSKADYSLLVVLVIGVALIFSEQGIDANWCSCKFTSLLGQFSTPLFLCQIAYRNNMKLLFPSVADRNKMLAIYVVLSFGTAVAVMILSNIIRRNAGNMRNGLKNLMFASEPVSGGEQ